MFDVLWLLTLAAAVIVLLIFTYRDRYRDCMRTKNDEILCDIYARPR